MKRLRDLDGNDQKELIKLFINKTLLALNAKLDKTEVETIHNLCVGFFFDSNFYDGVFLKIYNEIITNYRRYTPFCYASIRTAMRELSNKDEL